MFGCSPGFHGPLTPKKLENWSVVPLDLNQSLVDEVTRFIGVDSFLMFLNHLLHHVQDLVAGFQGLVWFGQPLYQGSQFWIFMVKHLANGDVPESI